MGGRLAPEQYGRARLCLCLYTRTCTRTITATTTTITARGTFAGKRPFVVSVSSVRRRLLLKRHTVTSRTVTDRAQTPRTRCCCCGPDWLTELGERVVVTHVVVSVHVVPGTLASALPCTPRGCLRRRPTPCGGCVGDPGSV